MIIQPSIWRVVRLPGLWLRDNNLNFSLIECLFLVAGPSSLSDSVRRALRSGVASPRAALSGVSPVTLHVENFGM